MSRTIARAEVFIKDFMDDNKKVLISGITVSAIIMIFAITFTAYGGASEIYGLLYAGIIAMAAAIVISIGLIIWYIKRRKNTSLNNLTPEMAELAKKYKSAMAEVGYVTFLVDGIKFAAEGKFACVKDFNGIKGYHFAFRIEGNKLVSKPDDYDDVLDYESLLFTIEIGYFDGVKLSEPENDNGIVLNDISNLEGKTINIEPNKGYCAHISTVEWDDIDKGEITFEEWNEEKHVISFLLLASNGVSEVIVGKVELLPDND